MGKFVQGNTDCLDRFLHGQQFLLVFLIEDQHMYSPVSLIGIVPVQFVFSA
jgi:hypothetical protein